MAQFTRRKLLHLSASAVVWPMLAKFHSLAAPWRRKVKITDIKVMAFQGGRTYNLVKVETDAGVYGIGEAYGSPGIGVKEGILDLKNWLMGKDPLDIETLYTHMGRGTPNLSGTRTEGSAHQSIRAVSGVEMALWDLAGKLLDVPVVTLLGGKYRDKVRMYCHESPKNMLDKASCREWAQRVKQHPSGWTAFKFGFGHTSPEVDKARDLSNRMLTSQELRNVAKGFENCREAIGPEADILVHCHWEYNLPTAIQIAKAIEPMNPFCLEDPLSVDYSESWLRLVNSTRVPILMGENLDRRERFKDFIVNQACDIVQLDVRNTGGLLESKKIADLAHTFNLPMTAHNTGSLICVMATAQWAASVRDFIAAESVLGKGDWMDNIVVREGPLYNDGYYTLPDKPGLGVELNRQVVEAHLAPGEKWWG
jgi:L-alanine-DL-glutamate epimerase-like enolase superfamily enzyme